MRSQLPLTSASRSDDTDGSGELDMKEFATAVRKDLAIGDDIITDAELESLFKQVDVDGGGEVDAEEFVQWLFEEPAKKERSKRL